MHAVHDRDWALDRGLRAEAWGSEGKLMTEVGLRTGSPPVKSRVPAAPPNAMIPDRIGPCSFAAINLFLFAVQKMRTTLISNEAL